MARPGAPLLPATLLLATAVLLSTAGHAQSTAWEFTSIADSSAELASFSVPSVNDAGQIAFVATFDDPAEGQVVYRQEANGSLTIIADTSGPIASFSGDPDMNASGLVTFTATLDDGSVSVLYSDGVGAPVTIANTVADALTSIDSKPFIGDTGGVVVVRAVRSADGARVILKGAGGPPATLVDSTGSYDPQDVAGINATDAVAFEALDATGAKGVFRTTDGVTVTPIAVTGGADGFTNVEALDINNNGTVVFFTATADVENLAVDTTGTPVVFAETADSPFDSFGPASVAESGAVAFRGIFEQGLNGIFAGGTGLYEKAIALGDPLLGSGVTALDTGARAVTNSGPFVFRASRGNGTTGIYVGVPSTSGGGGGGGGGGAFDGASVGLLLLANCLRRRRRPSPGSGARIGP